MSAYAARAMVVLVAIGASISCLNILFEFLGMRVATDPTYLAAVGAAGSSALAMLMLDLQHYGYAIAGIFFGLWLVPLGYLAFKSGMFPKALGHRPRRRWHRLPRRHARHIRGPRTHRR